ncbi:MAG: hypothetical protein BroJett040_24150 [Oligoflexia bacterium]|nr:MAG: hypothetical protein BroJett040_24150 [Oligoflexia bacterium]
MIRKRGLSIRYKILFLLTLLPLVMLGLYLGLAIKVFQDDKIAYVFESSSSVARTLSAQATAELNSILNTAKPVMQEFIAKRKFDDVALGVLEVDSPLQWIGAYELSKTKSGEFTKLDIVEREAGAFEIDSSQVLGLDQMLLDTYYKGRSVHVPFQDERVLIIEKIGQDTQAKIFVMMAKVTNLAQAFRNPSGVENFLVSQEGKILFGPAGTESANITTKVGDVFFEKTKTQQYANGTEGIRQKNGDELLASYSKSGFGAMTVISVVPKNEALKAVTLLIRRSVIFMGLLLGVTVILSLFASGNLTSALSDLFLATKKVAEGHFDIRVNVKSSDEVGSLADSFNAMAEEVSRLMQETAEKARMESELKTAQTVQETLFPAAKAQMGPLMIVGHYEPASECGGDWWHYCEVGNKVFLWIGDATGHGAPAALITSAAKSAATIIERLKVDPAQALSLLNRAIHDVSKGRIMMTFFLGCFNKDTGEFVYSNASHEAPFLIKKGEAPPKKKDLIPLNDVVSPRLGQAKDTAYDQVSIMLSPGDRIFFYTDGIPDVQSPDKEPLGEREFIKALIAVNAAYPPIDKSVSDFVQRISQYRKKTPLIDDVTLFMCEYTG